MSEAQGYPYGALLRTAELAEKVWRDEPYARRLCEHVASLPARFTADFWMREATDSPTRSAPRPDPQSLKSAS